MAPQSGGSQSSAYAEYCGMIEIETGRCSKKTLKMPVRAPPLNRRIMQKEDRVMKKWEYRIVDSKDVCNGRRFKGKKRTDVEAYLDELGVDGWEIINLDFRELERTRFEFSGVAKREASAKQRDAVRGRSRSGK